MSFEYYTTEDYGIRAFELYAKNLKYTEVQKVIDFLDRGVYHKIKNDPYSINPHLKSTYLIDKGAYLRIYQSSKKSNGIGVLVDPSTFLSGKYQPIEMWEPTKDITQLLLALSDGMLKEIGLDRVEPTEFILSQITLAENFWFDKGYDLTSEIHCYHKCFIPRYFKVIESKDEDEGKHLFVMKSKFVTVKAYDTIYELKRRERCPKSLKDKSILSFEVSLKGEAFLKRLSLNSNASLYKMLLAGYEYGLDILRPYQVEMFPFSGDFVRYDVAKQRIESSIKDSLLKEQMLYLLEKTSDSAGLSTAVRKLKDHYKNVGARRIEKILSEFDKLGIAPITIPKK